MFLKYSNLGITPVKITEIIIILRNSEKNRRKSDEKIAKYAVSFENQPKLRQILKKMCRSLEKSQKSGMVERKKCRSRQELSDEYLLAKFGFDTAYRRRRRRQERASERVQKCMQDPVGDRSCCHQRAWRFLLRDSYIDHDA